MIALKFIFSTIIFILLACSAMAEPATVISVHDGDTFTVRYDDGSTDKIRLFGIDCPELAVRGRWGSQPYSRKAANLVKKIFARHDRVTVYGESWSYGRLVAGVITLDDGFTVQEALVSTGLAWVDPRYCKDSKPMCVKWKALEAEAREERRGLWYHMNPTAPWDWRRGEDGE